MVPMGTASTGPESLEISVAIGLPSFLPSCSVTNILIISSGNRARERGETEGEMGNHEREI